MSRITTYFTFNGNCREAMAFYQECFGGELRLQTVGESPLADKLPRQMKNYIVHASLRSGNLELMGTDMVGEQGLVKGNAVATLINCSDEEELRSCYAQLSRGGEATHPIENTFWGALFGELIDKYGNHWLFNYTLQNTIIMTTQKMTKSVLIGAPKERIWDVLLQDETYRIWTSVFHEDSCFEGDWAEGSKIYFKTPEGDGMVSEVAAHRPNEIITLKHQGVLIKGKEVYDSEEAKKWKGATETYRLIPKGKKTELVVEQDIPDEYADWFFTTWEKALNKVKELSESSK